jgi:hypothetical protein
VNTTPTMARPGVIRWGNLPVPYVAAWSSEARIIVRPDPLLSGAPGLFRDGRRGEGRPLFGKMSEARVRRVVREQRCQVCAQVLSPLEQAVMAGRARPRR